MPSPKRVDYEKVKKLCAEGLDNKTIAARLGIGMTTVHTILRESGMKGNSRAYLCVKDLEKFPAGPSFALDNFWSTKKGVRE